MFGLKQLIRFNLGDHRQIIKYLGENSLGLYAYVRILWTYGNATKELFLLLGIDINSSFFNYYVLDEMFVENNGKMKQKTLKYYEID